MTMKSSDWNYDRMITVKAQMDAVMNDVLMCLARGYVSGNVKERMEQFLRNSADDISKLKIGEEQ